MDTTAVTVPDLGDFQDVLVVEIHVNVGDDIGVNDPLITVESDKSATEVPSSSAGRVTEVLVAIGDRVSMGSEILRIAAPDGAGSSDAPEPAASSSDDAQTAAEAVPVASSPPVAAPPPPTSTSSPAPAVDHAATVHAGPAVRRLARELGVDLASVRGTGPGGRITRDDLVASLAPKVPETAAATSGGIPTVPLPDFAKFGEIETVTLPRIKQISGPALHRSWLNVPHVTHNDEADITDLDPYRKELDTTAKADGYRVTLLAFLLKAAVSALREFPDVNSSLTADGTGLVVKKYFHIGVAVDTPNGLVVPVIRDVDRKGVGTLSRELGELSAKARDGKLTPSEMQGATFTISSLGGIGGTSFTPIVNAPEVAILGVVRSKVTPVWDGESFQPRLMLPLSLSYDHRVIDGALAARFTRHLAHVLEDVRRLVL